MITYGRILKFQFPTVKSALLKGIINPEMSYCKNRIYFIVASSSLLIPLNSTCEIADSIQTESMFSIVATLSSKASIEFESSSGCRSFGTSVAFLA